MSNMPVFSFSEEAKYIFSFLEKQGFSCVSSSLTKVRYESPEIYIDIIYGETDGEIYICFGRKTKNENFSFTLFLRLVNPDLEKRLGERLATSTDEISECLTKLASALQSEGQAILNGEHAIFEKMIKVRWWDFQPDAVKQSARQS